MNREDFYLSGEDVREPIRYRACGLDGIYLHNGYRVEEHDGEEHIAVTDVDGLHNAIGRHLVIHRKGLSPKEVRFLRNTMNLTQAEMAERLGNNAQSVARWEKGETEMPGTAEKLLRAVFLASLMSDSELVQLRDFLVSRLNELDQIDESADTPAEFQFCEHWSEREKIAA
ncbi:helix-turn-helix domain-containing protein [Sphingomonas sp. LB-2]|uniref:helix-turn-helix domain-containing protein n=1 Tax=Sphingomonas caeni TaxID=2984949 RepID=UPI0022309B75|nr:helix-turn-helix domain-containing protein [Sphingomonas caeni]MCW3846558.1 helix-turn-helix domain-containing protein [Sphingomonas caeni]